MRGTERGSSYIIKCFLKYTCINCSSWNESPLTEHPPKKEKKKHERGGTRCGLNGFHSRNEMTNLSARTPHPFLWGKRLLDPDRYLPKKQDPLFEKRKSGAHVYQRPKKESPVFGGVHRTSSRGRDKGSKLPQPASVARNSFATCKLTKFPSNLAPPYWSNSRCFPTVSMARVTLLSDRQNI